MNSFHEKRLVDTHDEFIRSYLTLKDLFAFMDEGRPFPLIPDQDLAAWLQTELGSAVLNEWRAVFEEPIRTIFEVREYDALLSRRGLRYFKSRHRKPGWVIDIDALVTATASNKLAYSVLIDRARGTKAVAEALAHS